MKPAIWYQIHTNGGAHTFARYYEGQTAYGAPVYMFEKMSADTTGAGQEPELFGREAYETEAGAVARLLAATEAGL
jgi:hypothetical protein